MGHSRNSNQKKAHTDTGLHNKEEKNKINNQKAHLKYLENKGTQTEVEEKK